jgi:hypothetical protein
MSIAVARPVEHRTFAQFLDDLNGRYHRRALWIFMAIVLAHWAEHVVQAFQIWVLGWPRPQARGLLGLPFPWLVRTEALHYGYAIVMLIGIILLRPGFSGRARTWWNVALVIQFWHHFEHALLLSQAIWHPFFGKAVPTSIVQLVVPRVELHLFYNGLVFIPMVIAMYLHLHPTEAERHEVACTCAVASRREMAAAGATG